MGAAVCIETVGANASGNAMPSTTGKLLLQAGAATALPWALGEKRGRRIDCARVRPHR